MASAFTHAFAAFAIGKSTLKKYSTKIAVLGMICAIFPDVDVLSFHYGIPYGSFWGHRGFIHSILFALLFSLIITSLFFRSEKTFSKTLSWFVQPGIAIPLAGVGEGQIKLFSSEILLGIKFRPQKKN